MELPKIIQGGMGAGVSNWELARTVSMAGLLGVVSGTALDLICARRLQDGDPCGAVRRACESFPIPEVAEKVVDRYFVEGGKSDDSPYRSKTMIGHRPSKDLTELLVLSNFVEVWLAKEGHDGPIAINYLDKIQAPVLPSLYGAMLAGVDVVTVGAGIPLAIPGAMAGLAKGRKTSVDLYVTRTNDDFRPTLEFDPSAFFGGSAPELATPKFLPIIAAAVLATKLMRNKGGPIDGFVIETPTAGGHNAPPRGWQRGDPTEEPPYGPRDEMNYEKIKKFGLPFWIGGSYGDAGGLARAEALGAHGIQVGTLFAFSNESGLDADYRRRVIESSRAGDVSVFTDPVGSPTGFPFKVVNLPGTNALQDLYEARKRVCDLGYLREAYETDKGDVGWRCPSEPLASFERRGGALERTAGRKCLCNGLMANIGHPQLRPSGEHERALLTAGDHAKRFAEFLPAGATSYSARDVVRFLLGETPLIGS